MTPSSPSSWPQVGVLADEPHPPGGYRRFQRRPRAVGHHPAVVDDHDPVSDLVGFMQVVGGEQDGPAFLAELADHLPERTPGGHVHRRRGLVQEDELRVTGDGDGEANALDLAPRQALGLAVQQLPYARPSRR